MCGRFVSARKRLELLEEFGVERDRVAASPDPEPAPDYNVLRTITNHSPDVCKGAGNVPASPIGYDANRPWFMERQRSATCRLRRSGKD